MIEGISAVTLGRVIFYIADVDALYDRALAAGYQPATVPRDAEWGERFFHLMDPTATNSVSLALWSRFPFSSSSEEPPFQEAPMLRLPETDRAEACLATCPPQRK
jgi:hypothetical protein